jgi:membrane-bound ClpP family serine protease
LRQRAKAEGDAALARALEDARSLKSQAEERISHEEAVAAEARARAMAEMEELQRTVAERAGRSREEAIEVVSQARQDAEAIRTEVREYMERARMEASTLARRRDNIASQLGQLSGVIEALAVPENPGGN